MTTMYPMIAYNIGINKLIFQDTQGQAHQYIHDLEDGETFLNFCAYNNLLDIGFTDFDDIILDKCMFIYLTLCGESNHITINLMLVDIFLDNPRFKLFRSIKKFFYNKQSKINDIIFQNILYSTPDQNSEHNKRVEIKLINQFHQSFSQQKLMDIKEIKIKQTQLEQEIVRYRNSMKQATGQKQQSDAKSYIIITDQYVDQEDNNQNDEVLAPIKMTVGHNGYIWYLTITKGQFNIKEINPAQDQFNQHTTIYQINSERCYGFQRQENDFYFIDDTKQIIRLIRQEESRMLREHSHYQMKDKDRPNFIKNESLGEIIFNSLYIIQKAKIFYISNTHRNPYRAGIMDMEDLLNEHKENLKEKTGNKELTINYIKGPITMEESNEFMIIYKEKNTREYRIKIYKRPETKQQIIMRNYSEQLEFSTFLPDGQILLKMQKKFMIFDQFAEFVNSVNFYKQSKLSKHEGQLRKQFKRENMIDKETQDQLVLKAISENHQYFLFFKQEQKIKRNDNKPTFSMYYVFELVESGETGSIDNQENCKMFKLRCTFDLQQLEFIKFFQIDIKQKKNSLIDKKLSGIEFQEKSHMFSADLEIVDEFAFKYELDIKNDGSVHIIQSSWNKLERTVITVKALFIDKDLKKQEFEDEYTFSEKSITKINDLISEQMGILLNKIRNESSNQIKLPTSLQSFTRLDVLQRQYDRLMEREAGIIKVKLFSNISGNMLIVKCGNVFQLTYINYEGESHYKIKEEVYNEFSPSVEIVDILNTCVKYQLQIVAKDNDKNVLIIQTWDFNKKCEVSMFQKKIEANTYPEYHILRGINHKRNYFADKYFIYDLETNMPMQHYFNPMNKNTITKQKYNIKKVFNKNDRQLSSEKNNILNYPYSRRDLLLWQNINNNFGNDPKVINDNTDLKDFLTVYKNITLFHHFFDNPDIIQLIFNKYRDKYNSGQLTEEEQSLQLLIFHRDNNGKTALDYARNQHRYRSFKIFIEMITYSNYDYLYSKLMLESLPYMLNSQSETYNQFFDKCFYQPPLIKENLIITWPEDMDDFVFASNTSIITQKLVENELKIQQYIKDNEPLGESMIQVENTGLNCFWDESKIAPLVLGNEIQIYNKKERIKIQILDFDWLFEENDELSYPVGQYTKPQSNAFKLTSILAHLENTDIFAQKSIQIVIRLLWKQIQVEIVNWIFLPQIAFSLFFLNLSQYVDVDLNDQDQYGFAVFNRNSRKMFVTKICIILGFQVYFIRILWKQFRNNPGHFLKRSESWLNIFVYAISIDIVALMSYDCNKGQKILTNPYFRAYYSFKCFVLWVKLYFMMRIFKKFAQFITVINEIVQEIRIFMVMLIILLAAFSNFFYDIDDNEGYIERYVKYDNNQNSFLNSFITTYLISIGEFSISGFSKGPEQPIMWLFFIFASFVVLIVFMNLLITIIAEKYIEVVKIQEQQIISMQAEMLIQYEILLDEKRTLTTFKNMKYAIYISKHSDSVATSNTISELFETFKKELFKKNEHSTKNILRKDEQNDINTRMMIKQMVNQQKEISKLKNLVNDCMQINVRSLAQAQANEQAINRLSNYQQINSPRIKKQNAVILDIDDNGHNNQIGTESLKTQ